MRSGQGDQFVVATIGILGEQVSGHTALLCQNETGKNLIEFSADLDQSFQSPRNREQTARMTSRNLTEVFVIMRNNASKNRNHYDDRVSASPSGVFAVIIT